MTKTEIKKFIKDELKCPTDFIERCLNASGIIDNLKEAADNDSEWQFVMKEVYESYQDYCKSFDLDVDNDNTGFKRGMLVKK